MSLEFWHIGIVVASIEDAKAELTRALGVESTETVEATAGEWTYRGAMSKHGPPYFELMHGAPGSPWDASAGSRLDHLAYWVDDLEQSQGQLEAAGIPVEVRGRDLGLPMSNRRSPRTELRLELVGGFRA